MTAGEDMLATLQYWQRVYEESAQVVLCHPDRVGAVQAAVDRSGSAAFYEVRGSDLVAHDEVLVADPNGIARDLRRRPTLLSRQIDSRPPDYFLRALGLIGRPPVDPELTQREHVERHLVPLVRAAADEVPLPTGRIEVARGLLRTSRTVEQALLAADQERWWTAWDERERQAIDEAIREHILALAAEVGLPHETSPSCWCRPVQVGPNLFHRDPRVPPGYIGVPFRAEK